MTPYGVRYRFQGIREVILKPRQIGFSTLIEALLFWDTIMFPGTETKIYCQDEKRSKKMLLKPKMFYKKLPEHFRPVIGNNSSRLMTFPALDSAIEAHTPGVGEETARSQGRSETFRNLHASEFAEWRRGKLTLDALMESIPKSGNIFIESSPDVIGDDFHVLYNKGLNPKSVWNSRFFHWWEEEDYFTRVSEEERKYLLKTMSKNEKELVKKFHVSIENIQWRRDKISEKQDDETAFIKEYPTDDKTCFESKQKLFFPRSLHKTKCLPRDAIPGHIHVIGVDVSFGTPGNDKSAIVVIDAITLEQIYEWSDYVDPAEELPEKIYEVWKKYPGIVGCEVNQFLVTIREMMKIQDWQTPHPGFLFSNNNLGGWLTTGGNKSTTLFQLKKSIRQAHRESEHGVLGVKISGEQIIKEMGWFQRLKKGNLGAPDNQSKDGERLTDDTIMAFMIAFGMIPYIGLFQDQWEERFSHPDIEIIWNSSEEDEDEESPESYHQTNSEEFGEIEE